MENRIWFLVISLGVLWGSSFLFVEILLQYLNPITIVFLRVSIASAVLISFIVASKQTYLLSASDLMSLLIMGFFNNVIPFTFITIQLLSAETENSHPQCMALRGGATADGAPRSFGCEFCVLLCARTTG